MMVVNFDEIAIPEYRLKVPRGLGRAVHLAFHEGLGNRPTETARQNDEPLGMFGEQLKIDARLVIIAVNEADRNKFQKIAIARFVRCQNRQVMFVAGAAIAMAPGRHIHLAPDDRLDPLGFCFEVELKSPIQDAVIGERNCRHAKLGCAGNHFFRATRAVKQRVFAVGVKVNEAARHSNPIVRANICLYARPGYSSSAACGLTCEPPANDGG